MKKIIGDLVSWIIPSLLIGLFIVGAIHGKKKHNVDPFSANFFVCWYYGIETVWHKTDFKELNDDIKVVVFLIMTKPVNSDAKDQLEFNETKKDIKKVIEKLDSKELEYVKSGVTTFIDYTASFQQDMIDGMMQFKQTQKMNISLSKKTNSLAKKCTDFGLEKEMNELKSAIEKFSLSIKEKMENNPYSIDKTLIQEDVMKAEMKMKSMDIKNTYMEIFDK